MPPLGRRRLMAHSRPTLPTGCVTARGTTT
ncbi:hypothetical protein FAGKG844_30130 [Frankia sp. AgKG'84/4]